MTRQLLLQFVLLLFVAATSTAANSLFDYSALDHLGQEVPLSKFVSAKVLIVVNVASNCGYTYTNYRELAKLHERYHEKGLEIVAFPSNQFGEQEPGSNQEIQTFVSNYGVKFPVLAKVDVNGPSSAEVFSFLREKTGGLSINWNFNKFLVVDGVPIKRYISRENPMAMEKDIRGLLGLDEDGQDL